MIKKKIADQNQKNQPMVRALVYSDLPNVERLDMDSEFDMAQYIKDYGEDKEQDSCYGLFVNDVLIGYCEMSCAIFCSEAIVFHPLWSHKARLLTNVYVERSQRHRGMGTLLLKNAMQQAERTEPIYLTLHSPDLKCFYQRLGFESIDGADYAMVWTLNNTPF